MRVAGSRRPRALPQPRVLRSRVARRVLALFLLTAALPIVLAGWAAYAALEQATEASELRAAEEETRSVAAQVHRQLQAAALLLAEWPEPAAQRPTDGPLAGMGSVFRGAMAIGPDGRPGWSTPTGWDLQEAWQRPAPNDSSDRRAAKRSSTSLRAVADGRASARILLGHERAGRLVWIAEVNPGYVWEPVDDGVSAAWAVRDAGGALLHEAASVSSTAAPRLAAWHLFLAGDFGAGEWRFERRSVPAAALLHGASFGRWLVSACLVTLLAATLLAIMQIRRTMGPLDALRRSALAISRRDYSTRVDIRSGDEFEQLAQTFNAMAARIEHQVETLECTAAIDRAIIARASLGQVVGEVLATVRVLAPGAASAVAVADPDEGELCVYGQRAGDGGSTTVPQVVRCTLPEAPFGGTYDDRWLNPDEAPAWAAQACAGGHGRLLLLPSRPDASLQVALAVRADPGLAAETHAALRDLRDRLAVAMTTWERERELVRRAMEDHLTGVATRLGLIEHLGTLRERSGTAATYALVFVDLDRFKMVNDTLGHEAGDSVLREAAARIVAVAPPPAFVARLGGDEFVVVLPGADAARATSTARAIVERLGQRIVRGDHSFVLGASAGIALAPEHGTSHVDLLRHADQAVYAAKRGGRGRVVVFTLALDDAAIEQAAMTADLHEACDRGELVLEFQPRVHAHEHIVTSAEALVRWNHPRLGRLLPGRFIALAEETDLIRRVDELVLDMACAQWRRWWSEGLRLARVSVNVSARTLRAGGLAAGVGRALERHRMPAAALELEITEGVFVDAGSDVLAELASLRAAGVKIALDDFGTGYSSMAMLQRLPVDVIKVDRTFVTGLGSDPMAWAIARAITTLADSLGLATVAEGVETAEQAAALVTLGAGELQGFLYARPLAPADFAGLPLLARRSAESPETVL